MAVNAAAPSSSAALNGLGSSEQISMSPSALLLPTSSGHTPALNAFSPTSPNAAAAAAAAAALGITLDSQASLPLTSVENGLVALQTRARPIGPRIIIDVLAETSVIRDSWETISQCIRAYSVRLSAQHEAASKESVGVVIRAISVASNEGGLPKSVAADQINSSSSRGAAKGGWSSPHSSISAPKSAVVGPLTPRSFLVVARDQLLEAEAGNTDVWIADLDESSSKATEQLDCGSNSQRWDPVRNALSGMQQVSHSYAKTFRLADPP